MKFFAVFAAILALSAAAPTTGWTLHELSQALQNPATPAGLIPYLQDALNTMMESAFAGEPLETITVSTPGGLLPVEAVTPIELAPNTQWTLEDLSVALQNPATPAELRPYLEHALNSMMESIFAGQPIDAIVVPVPGGLLPVDAISPVAVMPVELAPNTQWTLEDLSVALQNPATPAELRPYLEHALNVMMESIFAGQAIDSIAVPTPAGLLPVDAISPVAVMPVEVIEEPIAPAPVAPAPVAPETPAVVAEASGSPLVQIIVNIKSQEAAAETPAVPESPVLVPGPVIVAPGPAVVPPVIVAPQPENPLDIISINPVLPGPAVVPPVIVAPMPNPIDVIAVGQPDINPIDLLQPVPVAVAGGAPQGILV